MKKFFIILFTLLICSKISYSMPREQLYRFMSEAQNEVAFNAIEYYCSNEDPGLEIDAGAAHKIFFSKPCKCAIKSGEQADDVIAEYILDQCGL
tara:strand:+ start:373 stop:654 length:282 start_codon:yes stop_codon:yes gene_type:complete